jgi:hypothetical protein
MRLLVPAIGLFPLLGVKAEVQDSLPSIPSYVTDYGKIFYPILDHALTSTQHLSSTWIKMSSICLQIFNCN